MSGREGFLQRVRQAVAEGNRAGAAPPLPDRGRLGYQGGGPDAVARFAHELHAAGGVFHGAADMTAARQQLRDLVRQLGARHILVGHGPVIDALDPARTLADLGVCAHHPDAADVRRDDWFAADLGISGVAWLIAETGTLVAAASPEELRSLTLLPPLHIAIADKSQLLPDLFDLYAQVETMPSCLTLITGPSKTGDIELKLVTGVHGPGELHVILIG